jgi:hypothetical protein
MRTSAAPRDSSFPVDNFHAQNIFVKTPDAFMLATRNVTAEISMNAAVYHR